MFMLPSVAVEMFCRWLCSFWYGLHGDDFVQVQIIALAKGAVLVEIFR